MGEFTSYDDAAEHQLREWAEGRPWHNPWSPGADSAGDVSDKSQGECCPDFSCCVPQNIWPREKRFAFVASSDGGRESMMLGALSGLARDHDAVVLDSESGEGQADG